MSEAEISDRINGRIEAEQLLELRDAGQGQAYNRAFAIAMRDFADGVLGPVQFNLRVMTDIEASQFERDEIPFGKYSGTRYEFVPIDYLAWVADQSNYLAAYLRSKRGQSRLDAPTTRSAGEEAE